MTYAEADRRFGSDKPDTRFGLELEDATELTRGSEFGVFAGAEAVRFLRVPRDLLARRGRQRSRSSRRSAARRGSRTSMRDEERGAPLADRQVPLRGGARGARGRSRARRCSSPPTRWATTSRVLGAAPAPPRPRARADRRRRRSRSSGSPTSRCSSGTRRRAAGRRCTTRSRGRRTSGRRRFDDEPGDGARVRVRPHRQRQRARRRLVPDPRARPPGEGVRPARAHAGGAALASSASCSTRSRWARRRTAGSRSGSTA